MFHTIFKQRLLTILGVTCISAGAAAQLVVHDFQGTASAADRFGNSVRGVGDIDGDGYDDVIVGAPWDRPGGLFKAGSATVLSGRNGSVLFTFEGGQAFDFYGTAVGNAGDVDGDGTNDFIISAVRATGAGSNYVQVRSGANGSVIWGFSGSSADGFGTAVGGLGDVDGDGQSEMFISAPQGSGGKGIVYVRSGATGFPLYNLTGNWVGDRFGYSVSGGGDVNDDGTPDLIVGAPMSGTPGALIRGYIRVYSGDSGSLLHARNGTALNGEFGHATSLEADVDGDGRDDFLVGDPSGSPLGIETGTVRVYSGTGVVLYDFHGSALNDAFGNSVTAADVDGDGFADVVVGAPGDDTGGLQAGSVTVYSGLTDSSLGTVYGGVSGDGSGDGLGHSVARAGRISAGQGPGYDALEEIIIGGPKTLESLFPGRALVVTFASPLGSRYCGVAVNSAGYGARISASGSAAVLDNELLLSASQCPPSVPGLFYFGPTMIQIPFGDGFRCVTGPTYRLAPPTFADATGLATRPVDLTAAPAAGVILPGTGWNFQYWYRDAAAGSSGFNLTDAIHIDFL